MQLITAKQNAEETDEFKHCF